MKRRLLETLICPLCRRELEVVTSRSEGEVIVEALLVCAGCGHPYAVENTIPQMLSPFLPRYDLKMGEARGWVAISQAEGWYEPTEEIDLALPDVVEKLGWDPQEASGWVATQYAFGQLMDRFVKPGMRVLEVGAAKAWAGRFFLEKGCEYTACDVVSDAKIGLGRSRFFIERFGHYELVAADFESLPFRSESFDLVFAIAALHHALDLDLMVGEMARVCRVGGVVAGLNEGVRSFNTSPELESQADEKKYGINEHVYTLADYGSAFRRGGLHLVGMERSVGYERFLADVNRKIARRALSVPLIGNWVAPVVVLGFLHPYDGVNLYARK
ncbi:MAG: methyltransferase domain-containing protein [Caldilineaceae bacterium]